MHGRVRSMIVMVAGRSKQRPGDKFSAPWSAVPPAADFGRQAADFRRTVER
jgi:hypothetical protein